jgi:hypothetical protein
MPYSRRHVVLSPAISTRPPTTALRRFGNTAASPRKGGAWCLAPGGLRGAVFNALWEEHCARITPMNSQRWQCAVRLPRDAGDPGRARRVDRSATAASEASISVYQFSTAKMMSWSPPTCSRGIFVAVRAPSVASAGKDVFLGLLPRLAAAQSTGTDGHLHCVRYCDRSLVTLCFQAWTADPFCL